MRVVIVSENIGEGFGQEKVVKILTENLKRDGHKVFFIGARRKSKEPTSDGELILEKLFQLHNLSFLKKTYKYEIENFLKKINPDIIHIMDLFESSLMFFLTKNYSVYFTSHTVAPTCPASHRLIKDSEICDKKGNLFCLFRNKKYKCLDYLKGDLRRLHAIWNFLLKKKILKRFKGIIVISKYIHDLLKANGFAENKLFLVYNPVKTPESDKLNNAPQNLIIVASRLTKLKGVELLIKALNLIKDINWRLWICGEGPEKENLISLSKVFLCEDKIRFLGTSSFSETLKIIGSSSVFVQPNIGPEGFGLSLAEASSLGIPVVAFNVPALNEIVEHEKSGLLVQKNNVKELSQAIEKILKNKEYAKNLGDYGKKVIKEKFSEENFYKKTLSIYKGQRLFFLT